MSGRGPVLILTALMIVAASGIAAAQLQFTQTAPIPRPEIAPPKPRQPLCPVPPGATVDLLVEAGSSTGR